MNQLPLPSPDSPEDDGLSQLLRRYYHSRIPGEFTPPIPVAGRQEPGRRVLGSGLGRSRWIMALSVAAILALLGALLAPGTTPRRTPAADPAGAEANLKRSPSYPLVNPKK